MNAPNRLRRAAAIATGIVVATAVPSVAADGHAATGPVASGSHCAPRTLVLSAFPAELGPLLAKTKLSPPKPVNVHGHGVYLGRLAGHRVALAMTGIGLANARQTTRAALRYFRCHGRLQIRNIVFSGVGGGDFIGDVMVPSRWTADGKRFTHVNRSMMRTARRALTRHPVALSQQTPLGDPLCSCLNPDAVRLITVQHRPQVEFGGAGLSTDPFGGQPFPCVPGAGDVFGCAPCRAHGAPQPTLSQVLARLQPFLSPSFFAAYAASQQPPPGRYVDEDMETAAVARVARHAGVPFLGFRGASDGGGDPLHLPGFPVEFFVYRQLAADNAAAAALAFLQAWR